MNKEDRKIEVVGFFSQKGGVGRSLGLLSLAHYIEKKGYLVYILDLDLEAPGITFKKDCNQKFGVVDYLTHSLPMSFDKYLVPITDGIELVSAGIDPLTDNYFDKVFTIISREFCESVENINKIRLLISKLKGYAESTLEEEKNGSKLGAFILYDCRTGFSPFTTIVNTTFPDKLIMFLANNLESHNGTAVMEATVKLNKPNTEIIKVLSRQPMPSDLQEAMEEFKSVNHAKNVFSEFNLPNEFSLIRSEKDVEFDENRIYRDMANLGACECSNIFNCQRCLSIISSIHLEHISIADILIGRKTITYSHYPKQFKEVYALKTPVSSKIEEALLSLPSLCGDSEEIIANDVFYRTAEYRLHDEEIFRNIKLYAVTEKKDMNQVTHIQDDGTIQKLIEVYGFDNPSFLLNMINILNHYGVEVFSKVVSEEKINFLRITISDSSKYNEGLLNMFRCVLCLDRYLNIAKRGLYANTHKRQNYLFNNDKPHEINVLPIKVANTIESAFYKVNFNNLSLDEFNFKVSAAESHQEIVSDDGLLLAEMQSDNILSNNIQEINMLTDDKSLFIKAICNHYGVVLWQSPFSKVELARNYNSKDNKAKKDARDSLYECVLLLKLTNILYEANL